MGSERNTQSLRLKKKAEKKVRTNAFSCVSRREIEHTIDYRLFLCMPKTQGRSPCSLYSAHFFCIDDASKALWNATLVAGPIQARRTSCHCVLKD